MEDRSSLKKQEFAKLKDLYSKHPELFKLETFIDDEHVLRSVGIELPNKAHYPLGYLKLWPQDFIVEEVNPSGEVYTITAENLISDGYIVDPSHSTIYATLVKCGISTIEAMRDLSSALNCKEDQIQYAGIKDKEAITSQRISFRNIPIEKIKAINSEHFFLKDVVSGKGVVQKSQLKGNQFTILIRTEKDFTDGEKFQIFIDNLKKVKQEGFYNFYYLQRFGTPRLNNYLWAISILKGDYKQAIIDLLSDGRERELGFFKYFREDLSVHMNDWQYIVDFLKQYPLLFPTELKVSEYLLNHPEDYIGALNQIPDQVQLWMYALSSYLFNKKLSDAAVHRKLLPKELPLFLSFKSEDWQPYISYLKELGIYPPQFNNLKPFPFLQLRTRMVATNEHPEIKDAQITDKGILLTFFLQKGEYATTFLSHLFNLASSKVPESISDEALSPEYFGGKNIKKTLEYFQPILHSKTENFFKDEIS
ncbi:MAG: tRNA pseudouridine(13) synthase TruD [Candidatus Yanofskybacteria bacterium]|nr:tRNA pseudouridine(13) synthase TruD [Candidatus Yanofskybacteria bacterium]